MDGAPDFSATRVHAIARVLARRYGDGGVYVPRVGHAGEALREAIEGGFVSPDGFVTRKGRALVARFHT